MPTQSKREKGKGHPNSLNRVAKPQGNESPESVSTTASIVCAWSQEGREFGQEERSSRLEPTIKDLACLVALPPLCSQREAASQMLRSSLRRENTSTVKTETPLYKPPARTLGSLEKPQHTIPVLKLRNWGFCFCCRTGLREHTMPSVETPCLEGRTVAHLGKVRVKHK